ncbi:MAG TPA: zinc-binding dehydrogenase [Polyangiaceae bacterium]
MLTESDRSALQLVSLVKPSGELQLSLASVAVPRPGPDEVLLRVGAAPINPSDLLLLLAGADPNQLQASGTAERPVLTGKVPSTASLTQRLGQALPVGNEGAGTVVEAGASLAAQALLGKTVAVAPGWGMYAEYRVLRAELCLVLNDGTTAVQGASAWINPLTALGFVETMRCEGHTALANTAAASNLGQMLLRICLKDGIPLVNIVRSAEQVALLKAIGATHVCDSSAPTFLADLTEALAATGATIAFDAIGGGKLGGQILACMEAAINRQATSYNRYGSPTHKQLYIYGGLDLGPTEVVRSFGLAWSMGGWLVTPFLQKLEPAKVLALKQRIAAELTTTFASAHTQQVSLAEALQLNAMRGYAKKATGAKYLITPG